MSLMLLILSFGAFGFLLADAGITIDKWRYWALLACMVGTKVSGMLA